MSRDSFQEESLDIILCETVGYNSNMNSRIIALIPARLAATRLPDKPLLDLLGKTMIQRVWEQAKQAKLIHEVAVATPDEKIARVVESFGGVAVMTSASHRSGTDRLAEAATILGLKDEDIVVNLQGDEPVIAPETLDIAVETLLSNPEAQMSSLMCPCPDFDLDNPACVKVVCALNGDALYFSRARLPFPRNGNGEAIAHQHYGLYAYRRGFLRTYASLSPTPLEITESLEQLRVLEHGYKIRMAKVSMSPIGVDTPEDLRRVIEALSSR